MMEAVPENNRRPHAGPPAIRQPDEPAAVEPTQPPAIDPEQVRQFQQFQQFQELMRQQSDGASLLLPPTRKPLWKRVLGGKLVRTLVVLALLLATMPLWLPLGISGVAAVFSSSDDNLSASQTGGGTNKTNVVHEQTPKRTVRQVYSHVAQNDDRDGTQYEFVCGQFENGAELQFARNFNAATCKDAVAKLFAEIDKSQPGWRNIYAEPFSTAELGETPVDDIAVVSSCSLNVQPRLGEFTLRRIENGQWVITAHRLESC